MLEKQVHAERLVHEIVNLLHPFISSPVKCKTVSQRQGRTHTKGYLEGVGVLALQAKYSIIRKDKVMSSYLTPLLCLNRSYLVKQVLIKQVLSGSV